MDRSLEELLERRRFVNLSSHKFSSADKKWLGEHLIDKKITAHSICAATVRKWVRSVRQNIMILPTAGRPSLLDSTAKQEIVKELVTRRAADDTPKLSEFVTKLVEKSVESSKRRGGPGLEPKMSKSTVRRIQKILNTRAGKAQYKTQARILSEGDPRNAYSEALLLNAFQTGISPFLIINLDSTQFCLKNNNEGDDELVYFFDKNDQSPPTCQSVDGGDMGLAIKSHVLISAAGAVGPMVLMIADDSLGTDDLVVKKIVGISHSAADATSAGYLVFMKTRCANAPFFRW